MDTILGVGAGIGTGVAVLDVSVEPDKGEGTVMVDRRSKQFLAFPFNSVSPGFRELEPGGKWGLSLLT